MSGTRRKPGRLGSFVEGYRVWLLERGYTPGTVRGMLKVLGHLGRWMEREGLEPGELDVAALERFLACLRAEGLRRVPTFRRCAGWWRICAKSASWRPTMGRMSSRRLMGWSTPIGTGW